MPSQTTGFGGLLEAVPDALLGVDSSGVIRFVNHQSQLMFGYERVDLIGVPIESLVPESARQVHLAHQKGDSSTPKTRPIAPSLGLRGRRRDGTTFPVDVALSPMETAGRMLVIAAVRDMTRYRSAEEDRRRADRRLAVVEYSEDAIIGMTLEGIVTSWNPAAEKLFGYSRDEILGRSSGSLTPQDRASDLMAIRVRLRAERPVERLESMGVRKDGTVFPVSLTVSPTVSPIAGGDGAVVGASMVVRDGTDQKKAAQYARSLIEATPDSLVAISPEGKITDVNESMVKLTAVTRGQLIGTSFSEYFTEPARAEEIYRRVFTQGMAVDYPLTLRSRDGDTRQRQVLFNASVYSDADGAVLGAVAAARDMTRQRQAFDAARSMIEASLDSLVAISPEGTITDANMATVKLTGVSRDELIGTSFSDYFTDPDMAEAIYQQVFTQGMAVDYPLTLRHQDGHETLTDVLYNASVYRDGEGRVLGVFAAARDVTNLMQAHRDIIEEQAVAVRRLAELEEFQRLTVGRELKMIELKKEIEALRRLDQTDGSEGGHGH